MATASMSLPARTRFGALSLAALGVVYGDIGTSPLYALQVAFSSDNKVMVTRPDVLGILSMFAWSLILVVTLKYVLFVMRADNDGEGGIMALMALALRRATSSWERRLVIGLGLLGVALFYGDGVVTPAISVLSAVEGTSIVTHTLARWEVPLTVVILAFLFAFERGGTNRVGRLFGPVMVLWFATIAALGVRGIAKNPGVLQALSPSWAVDFFLRHPFIAFVALGAVVLCLTGAEALYADMGHFGRGPIAAAWGTLVLPSLVLCYFGQGALILRDPRTIDNPFFRLAPPALVLVLVVLATVATIIASQAVISGAYSMTQQAIQLGYLPRMMIRHTSTMKGQIYMPAVNWGLFIVVVILVVSFGSSSALAAAYGIAVTGTMSATTVLAFVVTRQVWGWPTWRAALVTTPLLAIDLAFFSANLLKVFHGGWFPLLFGMLVYLLMTTWRTGRQRVRDQVANAGVPLGEYLAAQRLHPPAFRLPGTAVFFSPAPAVIPRALINHLKHNGVPHEQTVFVTLETVDVPRQAPERVLAVDDLRNGYWRVIIRLGFMEEPDVPAQLRRCMGNGLILDPASVSYFIEQDWVLAGPAPSMAQWRKRLFRFMHWNAANSADYYHLPPDRVVQIGSHIVI